MFIDIGQGTVIRTRDIISIIDYDLISSSSITKEMMSKTIDNKSIDANEEAKSIIILKDDIQVSPLSVYTLKKRTSFYTIIEKYNQKQSKTN